MPIKETQVRLTDEFYSVAPNNPEKGQYQVTVSDTVTGKEFEITDSLTADSWSLFFSGLLGKMMKMGDIDALSIVRIEKLPDVKEVG